MVQATKEIVKIVRDILGIDAALDCLSTGDLGSCGETALNIAGSFAGGIVGKILAKYGAPWDWAKGARLAKRVVGLVDDLVGGVTAMMRSSKALGKAKDVLASAEAKVRQAAKRGKSSEPAAVACAKHSFLPGTKVLGADGTTKPIEDVEPGDKLIVTDPETGETTVREVAGAIVTEDDKHFVDLTIATGNGDDTASLVSTTTHPFWSVSENAWVDAGRTMCWPVRPRYSFTMQRQVRSAI
ncbi:polymorphic toxin-type HINT domain-containing protein [Streptomyces sp. NPDC005151]